MPHSMLPAMEKLSSHTMFFFSARYVNSAITRADTPAVSRGYQFPGKEKAPLPEMNAPK